MPFGDMLKQWRSARRMSQEDLADAAMVSTRHLSFLESGRSQPSRDMVLQLASALEVPLTDRNLLLGAAGFAAAYRATPLDSEEMLPIMRALELMLEKHEPYGAVVLDRAWNLVLANRGALRLFSWLMPEPPQEEPAVARNMVHALFHPRGLRPAIVNWEQVAGATLERLERELAVCPNDAALRAVRDAALGYGGTPRPFAARSWPTALDPVLTVHMRRGGDEFRLFSTLTTLGSPLDATAQELVIEHYYPADPASEEFLRRLGN